VARTHTGDYGVYGVIDQMLWRLAGDDPKKGIGAFTRFALSPPDRNLISLYSDAGINFIGLWDQRPDDKFGIAAFFSSLSPDVRELDLEKALFTQPLCPCAIMNWWWNSPIRRSLLRAGLFSRTFSTSSIPAPALSIPKSIDRAYSKRRHFRAAHCDQLLSASERVRIGRRGGKSHTSPSSIPPNARNLSSQWMS
jgi:Carbohydrate-selective porin, OprB family